MKAEVFAVLLMLTIAAVFFAHTTKVLDHDLGDGDGAVPTYQVVLALMWVGLFLYTILPTLVRRWKSCLPNDEVYSSKEHER